MAAYDWAPASPLRSDRAAELPPETHAADGKLLGWLAGMLAQDRHYHTVMATLTASENYPSLVVRAAAAFFGGEHYFFDAPTPGHCGEWSFPRSGTLPALQTKFLAQMKRLFAADIADWRPNGGSMCEQAVVMAACKAGDAFVELAPEDGGHFGATVLAERLGIESFAFPMRGDLIDVEGTVRLVEQHPSIRLLLVQPSHCRRPQPIEELDDRAAPAGHARGRRQPHRRPDRGRAAAPASPPGRRHPHVQHPQDAAGAQQGRDRLRRPQPSACGDGVGHRLPAAPVEQPCRVSSRAGHRTRRGRELRSSLCRAGDRKRANARAGPRQQRPAASPAWNTAAPRPTRFTCASVTADVVKQGSPTNCCRCAASGRTR